MKKIITGHGDFKTNFALAYLTIILAYNRGSYWYSLY